MAKKRGIYKNLNSIRVHRVARILVEAAAMGDAAAGAKHGISVKSVERYRLFHERGEGPAARNLRDAVEQKQKLLDGDFTVYIRAALNSHLDFLARAGDQLNPSDPHAVRAAAGALKLLGERWERFLLLDARLKGEGPVRPLEAPKAIKAA